MCCGHGWHGCGPYYRGPCDRGSWEPVDWFDDADGPMRRRYRRPRQPDPEMAAEDLEARLEQLRRMVRQVETELMELRSSQAGEVGK
jgi:hypothetical protein